MAINDFYRDKKVLVTGHTGFKGGWLTTWLKILGAKVIGYSLPPENGKSSFFETAKVQDNMISIFGDIKDFSTLQSVFEKYAPEIVFHMAAQPLVRRSYRMPVETYATNVMGTVNVFEAVRQTQSVRVIVNITSDKCYKNQEWVWGYREDDEIGGYDPYSSSKACAELITSTYRSSFFSMKRTVALASVRAGNVIGGGDWAEDRLIPDIIRALDANIPIILRNPHAIRPWQHVLEPLRGYFMLGESLWKDMGKYQGAWNFGPNQEDTLSVLQIAKKMIEQWGSGQLSTQQENDYLHESNYLRLDCSKAFIKLGWKPELNIDESLKMTVVWYLSYLKDSNMVTRITLNQIEEYMGRCL